MGKKPLPDFTVLRKMAEAASGARGDGSRKEVYLVYDPGATGKFEPYRNKVRVTEDDPTGTISPKAVVIKVASCSQNPKPTPPDRAMIAREKRVVDLLAVEVAPERTVMADSVFWTESAVEKFVVPYYASLHGPLAAKRLTEVLSVLHEPKAGAAAENFALIHLPTSEYVEGPPSETGGKASADEFFIARVGPTEGVAELVSLDEWVARGTAAEQAE